MKCEDCGFHEVQAPRHFCDECVAWRKNQHKRAYDARKKLERMKYTEAEKMKLDILRDVMSR